MSDIIFTTRSHKIIGAALRVHAGMGTKFKSAIYRQALSVEFKLQKIPFVKEKKFTRTFLDYRKGKGYVVDFICYETLMVQCIAVSEVLPEHIDKVMECLEIADLQSAMLINFGTPDISVRKVINAENPESVEHQFSAVVN